MERGLSVLDGQEDDEGVRMDGERRAQPAGKRGVFERCPHRMSKWRVWPLWCDRLGLAHCLGFVGGQWYPSKQRDSKEDCVKNEVRS